VVVIWDVLSGLQFPLKAVPGQGGAGSALGVVSHHAVPLLAPLFTWKIPPQRSQPPARLGRESAPFLPAEVAKAHPA